MTPSIIKYTGTMLAAGLLCIQTSITINASVTHALEATTAIAIWPAVMLANRADVVSEKQRAAKLHVIADIVRLINKGLFFYNSRYHQGQEAIKNNTLDRRDCWLSGGWTAHDMVNLYHHTKGCGIDGLKKISHPSYKTRELASLAYGFRTYILPSIEAIAAFILACNHDGLAHHKHARFAAAAWQSYARLAQNYLSIEDNIPLKRTYEALLFINFIALCHDTYLAGESTHAAAHKAQADAARHETDSQRKTEELSRVQKDHLALQAELAGHKKDIAALRHAASQIDAANEHHNREQVEKMLKEKTVAHEEKAQALEQALATKAKEMVVLKQELAGIPTELHITKGLLDQARAIAKHKDGSFNSKQANKALLEIKKIITKYNERQSKVTTQMQQLPGLIAQVPAETTTAQLTPEPDAFVL